MKSTPADPVDLLRHRLRSREERTDIVSFDVFDTLVRRSIAPPQQVKVPAAKKMVEILAEHRISTTVEACLQSRQLVSRILRKSEADRGNDPEAPIRQIFTDWLQHHLGGNTREAEIERLLQAELQAELTVCYPTAGMKTVLEEMKRVGKRLIYISDMYLGTGEVSRILERCEYGDLFDAGYISGNIGLSKKTGRLYQHVLRKENIDASALTHIGDDRKADVYMARQMGISALWFHDPVYEKWRIRHRRLKKLSGMTIDWEGARWAEMDPPDSNTSKVARFDHAYAIGLHLLGPVLTNFIHQVMDRVAHDGTEVVLFPAREGFILLSIYNRLAAELHNPAPPPGIYAFLSRQSTFLASVTHVGDREIIRGLQTRPTLRKMLNKLSLSPARLETIAARYGLDDFDEMIEAPATDERLQRFFSDPEFTEILSAARKRCKKLLGDYLQQCGFWPAARAALVDVGWTGTIQESLAMAFEERPEWPYLNGYYMSLLGRSRSKVQESIKSTFNGIYYDHRHSRYRPGLSRFTELFENATRAPHPTTIGYRRLPNGQVQPVLDESTSVFYTAEQGSRHLLASLQAGILDYVDRYAKTLPYKMRSAGDDSTYMAHMIDRLIRYPSKTEAAVLRQLAYSNEFGGMVFVPGKSATDVDALQNPSRERLSKGKVFNHMWREGVYADHPIPCLNPLFNLYRSVVKKNY